MTIRGLLLAVAVLHLPLHGAVAVEQRTQKSVAESQDGPGQLTADLLTDLCNRRNCSLSDFIIALERAGVPLDRPIEVIHGEKSEEVILLVEALKHKNDALVNAWVRQNIDSQSEHIRPSLLHVAIQHKRASVVSQYFDLLKHQGFQQLVSRSDDQFWLPGDRRLNGVALACGTGDEALIELLVNKLGITAFLSLAKQGQWNQWNALHWALFKRQIHVIPFLQKLLGQGCFVELALREQSKQYSLPSLPYENAAEVIVYDNIAGALALSKESGTLHALCQALGDRQKVLIQMMKKRQRSFLGDRLPVQKALDMGNTAFFEEIAQIFGVSVLAELLMQASPSYMLFRRLAGVAEKPVDCLELICERGACLPDRGCSDWVAWCANLLGDEFERLCARDRGHGLTPLHTAAISGRSSNVIPALKEYVPTAIFDSWIAETSFQGFTPLHCAAYQTYDEAFDDSDAEDEGSSENAEITSGEEKCAEPCPSCQKEKDTKTRVSTIQALRDTVGETIFDGWLAARDENGLRPLYLAGARNNVSFIRELHRIVHDEERFWELVTKVDSDHKSAFLYQPTCLGHVEIFRILRELVGRERFVMLMQMSAEQPHGWTPLYEAVKRGHSDLVLFLSVAVEYLFADWLEFAFEEKQTTTAASKKKQTPLELAKELAIELEQQLERVTEQEQEMKLAKELEQQQIIIYCIEKVQARHTPQEKLFNAVRDQHLGRLAALLSPRHGYSRDVLLAAMSLEEVRGNQEVLQKLNNGLRDYLNRQLREST